MKTNKVLILGIDALEYDLVEEWDLKNLKQEEYGKTILPISRDDGYLYSEPATVIMWPCFITGILPKKMGIETVKIYPLNFLYKFYLKSLSPKDGEKRETIKDKSPYRKVMDKISDFIYSLHLSREPTRRDIKVPTMFETIPNSIHKHIPVYDNDVFPPYKKKIVETIENKTYMPIFEMECTREFNLRTKEVFEWLERKDEWNLFMQYFFVLDGVQHAFFNNTKKIAKFYIMFDEFVGKVRKKIDDDTLLLIVSDHGQHKGIHTTHGFYSVNKPLGLKNPKLIDFRWIIEERLEGKPITRS